VAGTFQVIATSVEDSRKAAASQVVVTVKPKEGKETKDTKETGKEFTKEKEIRVDKIAENKLRDVIGSGVVIRTAPDAATAGTGQPFIQAAERPVLDGSFTSAPEPEAKVDAQTPNAQEPAVKKPLAKKAVAKKTPAKKPAAKKATPGKSPRRRRATDGGK
jgi:hypothetical protein